jgi:hypothetical protein
MYVFGKRNNLDGGFRRCRHNFLLLKSRKIFDETFFFSLSSHIFAAFNVGDLLEA